jgi:hypothetical protein
MLLQGAHMALIQQTDIAYSLIPETDFGVTPTAGATRYELPVSAEQVPLTVTASEIASSTKRPNRASNGTRRGMMMVDGPLDIRFQRHAFMDVLLESALSNTFASNVLKAGQIDPSFSVLALFKDGVDDEAKLQQFAGCMVSGFSIASRANDAVTSTWDIIGAKAEFLNSNNPIEATQITGATEFVGAELTNIAVAGMTLDIVELNFDTKLDRTRRPKLGSNNSLAFGVNGTRETTVTVKAYRHDNWTPETTITGLPQALSFDLGTSGYRVQLPAAYGSFPTTTLGDGSAFVEISFKAGFDSASGTDLIITRL